MTFWPESHQIIPFLRSGQLCIFLNLIVNAHESDSTIINVESVKLEINIEQLPRRVRPGQSAIGSTPIDGSPW